MAGNRLLSAMNWRERDQKGWGKSGPLNLESKCPVAAAIK